MIVRKEVINCDKCKRKKTEGLIIMCPHESHIELCIHCIIQLIGKKGGTEIRT